MFPQVILKISWIRCPFFCYKLISSTLLAVGFNLQIMYVHEVIKLHSSEISFNCKWSKLHIPETIHTRQYRPHSKDLQITSMVVRLSTLDASGINCRFFPSLMWITTELGGIHSCYHGLIKNHFVRWVCPETQMKQIYTTETHKAKTETWGRNFSGHFTIVSPVVAYGRCSVNICGMNKLNIKYLLKK